MSNAIARRSQLLMLGLATAGLIGAALLFDASSALASSADRCAKAEARLAATGRGDRDFDGLSNCTERIVLGTDRRDPDTDDDGLNDGDEIASGTDPLNPDSDQDGLSDGEEESIGTDPLDSDTDHDGVADGDDLDPADDLRNQIEGNIDSITCPADPTDGTLIVLGISITLTPATTYEGVASCDDLVAVVTTDGTAHVEVEVTVPPLGAIRVHLEDADNNGRPDDIEDDSPDDSTPDTSHNIYLLVCGSTFW